MKHLGEIYKGLTFSEAAKKIQAKYPKRDTDLIARKSYDAEIAELMKMNEMVKQANEATENVKQVMRNGGVIKKLDGGGPVTNNDELKLSPVSPLPSLNLPKSVNRTYDSMRRINTLPTSVQSMNNTPVTIPNPNTPPAENKMFLSSTFYDPFDPSLQAPKVNNPTATTANNYATETNTPTNNQVTLGDNATSVVNAQGQVEVKPGNQPAAGEGDKKSIFQKLYGKGSNIMNPALTGALANFGINAAMLAGGYDKVAPNTNKYESDIRTMMQGRGIDTTAVQNRLLSQQNLANQNLANVRSANVRNALAQNINAGAMTAASQAELQSQQMRNQLTGEYANQLNSLGAQDAQARNISEDLTARNKGAWQTGVSQLGASLADSGMFATKYLGNQQMERLKLEILNQSGSKFKISEDIMGKLQRNEALTNAEILQMQASGDANIKAFADFYTKQNPAAGTANQGGVTVNNTTLTTGNTVTPPAGTQTGGAGTGTTTGTPPPAQTGGTNPPATTTPTTTPTTPATISRPGKSSRGDDATYDLQQKLIAAGAKITADGIMGPKTKAAMAQYPNVVNAPATTTPAATPAPKVTTPTIVDDEPVTVIPADIDAQFAAAQAAQANQTAQNAPVLANPAQTGNKTVTPPATVTTPTPTPTPTTVTTPPVVTPAPVNAPANNPINLGLPTNITTPPANNQNQQGGNAPANTTPVNTPPVSANTPPAQTNATPAPASIKFNTPEEASKTYNTRMQNAITAAQSNNDNVIAKSEQEFKDMFASDKAVISIKTEKGTLVDEKDVNAFFNQALMKGSTGVGAKYSDVTNVKLDNNGKIISMEIIELDRPMPNREANAGKRKGKRK